MAPDSVPSISNNSGDWKAALVGIRTQIADYEREGTSTPGKLKRAARLRACRLALRDAPSQYGPAIASLKAALTQIEAAEKDDHWRRIAELVAQLLADLDLRIGEPDRG